MYEVLLQSFIGQFGYAAFFLALCLGIVGLPVPNEVVVITAGALAGTGFLHPVPAFLATYSGVVSGLSFGYFMGKYVGPSVLGTMIRKKNLKKFELFSQSWISKYGSMGISAGYFFPIVRHILPYLAGIHKMSYRKYAAFSYSAGFIWTLIYFLIGRTAGSHAHEIGNMLYRHGMTFLWLIVVLGAVSLIAYLSWNNRRTRV